jgi:hypothetical protein
MNGLFLNSMQGKSYKTDRRFRDRDQKGRSVIRQKEVA